MNKSETLAKRIEEVIYDQPWHGNNLETTMMQVTAKESVIRILGQHNIAELVYHMIQWKKFVIQKTFGDKSFDIIHNSPEDWKTIDQLTQGEWETLKFEFLEVTAELVQGLENFGQSTFSKPVPGRDYTYDHLLHGIVDHDIYQQGQISLIYKMIKV